MSSDKARTIHSRAVARRVAFDRYLRTGEAWSAATIDALADRYERKFNPNHDPADGRFTSGPGGPNTSRPKGDPNDPARFSGWISASNETYDFHPREGRTSFGDISNSIGEMLPGRKFRVYMVGTKQVNLSGRLPHAGR